VRSSEHKSRITKDEFTVVQKLNQGTIRQTRCIRLSGSFFVTFLEKQKVNKKNRLLKTFLFHSIVSPPQAVDLA
jgi:hypothetical protein